MFMKEDSFSEVKIVDFGFARHVSSMTVGTAGTLGYKAPEVFEGSIVGPKADMWSIGSFRPCIVSSVVAERVADCPRWIQQVC
jgi:serine/threonine protein kinase